MNTKYIAAALLCGTMAFTSCLDETESDAVKQIRTNQNALTAAETALTRAQAEADKALAEANVKLTAAETKIEQANAKRQEALAAQAAIETEIAELNRKVTEAQTEADKKAAEQQKSYLENQLILAQAYQADAEANALDQLILNEKAILNAKKAALQAKLDLAESQRKLDAKLALEQDDRYQAVFTKYKDALDNLNSLKTSLLEANKDLIEAKTKAEKAEVAKNKEIEKNNADIETKRFAIAEYEKAANYEADLDALHQLYIQKTNAQGLAIQNSLNAQSRYYDAKDAAQATVEEESYFTTNESSENNADAINDIFEDEEVAFFNNLLDDERLAVPYTYTYVDVHGIEREDEGIEISFSSLKSIITKIEFKTYNYSAAINYTPAGSNEEKTYAYVAIYQDSIGFLNGDKMEFQDDTRKIDNLYGEKVAEYDNFIKYNNTQLQAEKAKLPSLLDIYTVEQNAFNADPANNTLLDKFYSASSDLKDCEYKITVYQEAIAMYQAAKEALLKGYTMLKNYPATVARVQGILDAMNASRVEAYAPVIAAWKAQEDAKVVADKASAEYNAVEQKYRDSSVNTTDDLYGAATIADKIATLKDEIEELKEANDNLKTVQDKKDLIPYIEQKCQKLEAQIKALQALAEGLKSELKALAPQPAE